LGFLVSSLGVILPDKIVGYHHHGTYVSRLENCSSSPYPGAMLLTVFLLGFVHISMLASLKEYIFDVSGIILRLAERMNSPIGSSKVNM
jgi:hypothetical protein